MHIIAFIRDSTPIPQKDHVAANTIFEILKQDPRLGESSSLPCQCAKRDTPMIEMALGQNFCMQTSACFLA